MTETRTIAHPKRDTQSHRPTWLQVCIVTVVSILAMISMLPHIGIAKLLGVDMSKLSGLQFQLEPGPVLLFFSYGATVVLIVALAQRFLHRGNLLDLGFRKGFVIPILAGTIFGIATKTVWLMILLVSAEDFSFSYVVPKDVSIPNYIVHYMYFLIGFITLNSFIEELSLRAYPFENLRERIHPAALAVASSLIFTAGHFIIKEFSFPYALALMLYGLLHCYVYLETGCIWAVVGIHNGTNWFMYTFFGASWKIGKIYETTINGAPQWIADYSSCFACLLAIGVVFVLSRCGVLSFAFGSTERERSKNTIT